MKKIVSAILTLILICLLCTGCSFTEGLSDGLHGFIEDVSALIPNDLEYLLASFTGNKTENPLEDTVFSTGYVNMMKSDKFHMVYSLTPDGEEIEYGLSDNKIGTRADVHIILEDDSFYLINDELQNASAIDPASYPSAPFRFNLENITYVSSGEDSLDGKALSYEDYSAAGGSVRFWFSGSLLYAIEVSNGANNQIIYVLSMDKWVPSDLVTIPANYAKG